MKIQLKHILAPGFLCAGSILWFALTPSVPLADSDLDATPQLPGKTSAVESIPARTIAAAMPEVAEQIDNDEPGSVGHWHARFAALLAECGNRDAASARLVAELDRVYHAWVSAKLAGIANLPPLDRYDPLAAIESRMRKVAEAVLGHMGISGGRHYFVLADTVDAISAEVQYAEMRGTHDQRVAMLRLDRERANRFEKLVAANGLGAATEARVSGEIDPWYQSQLRGIVGANDRDEAE